MATTASNEKGGISSSFTTTTTDSLWNTLYEFITYTAKCVAKAVGMPNFTLLTPILLSIMTWCCFFMPPIAVFMASYWRSGNAFNGQVLYNIVFCLLLWLPGVVHALWFCYFDMVLLILLQSRIKMLAAADQTAASVAPPHAEN